MTTSSLDGEEGGSTRTTGGARNSAAIFLAYRLEEAVALEADLGFRHVERWNVSIFAEPAAEPEKAAIGYIQMLVLNLTPGIGVGDLVDRQSGDWVDVIEAGPSHKSRPGAGQNEPGALGNHILVLDRLWLEPAWRGRGLGPVAAAAAVLRLGRGCQFVACYPAPFEPTDDPDGRARSIEALGDIWAKVGFKLWDDGVWMLDLTAIDMRVVLQGLLRPLTADQT